MQAKSVEDLQIWQAALRFAGAVLAATSRGGMADARRLRDQIEMSVDSVLANLAEGFQQGTDRAFARYLFIARGSCSEVRVHLDVARLKGYVDEAEACRLREDAADLTRMLTGFIAYLLRSDRKQRG
jgi:four helix bundle protein